MRYALVVVLCCFLFAGCSTTTEVTYKTLDVTENPVGTKIGQIAREQGGMLEAAKNGGITRISTVSTQDTFSHTTQYWPLLFLSPPITSSVLVKQETIVTGE